MIDPSREAELNEALELFFFGYRAFTAGPDTILAERGLQRVHHRILYFVARNPGIGVNALLATLGVSKQALHGPLRRLVELGLVESAVAEHDRRARCLRVTAKGAGLEAELSGSQRERMDAIFHRVGKQGEADWREVMRLVAEG